MENTTELPIEISLIELERLTLMKSKLEDELTTLNNIRDELKEQIGTQMRKSNIKSVRGPLKKILVTVSIRREPHILDEGIVRTYLKSNGLLEECLRLDVLRVKRYAKAKEMPGIEWTEKEIIAIKELKEEAAPIEPDKLIIN